MFDDSLRIGCGDGPQGRGSSHDRVALVTGGSSGIGKASAQALLNAGYKVMISSRSATNLSAAWAELEPNDRCAWHEADMTRPGRADDVVAATLQRFERLDVLVTSHGSQPDAANFMQITDRDWEGTLNTNFYSVIALGRAAARAMEKGGEGGSIITISSVNGLRAEPCLAPYNVAKGAIISLTRSMAADLASFGIRVNCLAPGWILTPMTETHYAPIAGRELEGNMVRRIGQPNEIAHWVVFLAGRDSSYATGEVFTVDGGQIASLSAIRPRT